MLNVVCLNAGNYLGRGAEYVNNLHDMVRRNLPAGFAGRFVCFTDNADGLHGDIIARPLPADYLRGWYNKISLFKPGLFEDGDRVLYFDLDTAITGRLDELVKYDGEFAILRDFFAPSETAFSGWQSAVMGWRAGFGAHVWQKYVDAGMPEVAGGDQAWIKQAHDKADLWQVMFPGAVASYKASGGRVPQIASVVCFHGKPRPHEVLEGWVPEVWKVGGITRADLDSICNTEAEKLLANVSSSIKRHLPWLDSEPVHDGHAVIVGGAPSINGKIDEIKWRASLGQKIVALNGSATWLVKNGIRPDWHVIVDARASNARFVVECSEALIGSQCDPVVFEAAQAFAKDVTLFHSNTDGVANLLADETERPVHLIGGGSTVGLQAMVIAFLRGYRKIHLYGFDSSLSDDRHHAYEQEENNGEIIIDAILGNRKFRAAPWMVQQAEEFRITSSALANDGCVITVAGDGLLPEMAREMMRNPQVHSSAIRGSEILRRLPDGPVKGAEIGVFTGMLSDVLLQRGDLFLTMIDAWAPGVESYQTPEGAGDWHAKLKQEDQDKYYLAASSVASAHGERAKIVRAYSTEAAKHIPDCSLDFAFIDADHSYEGCKADIEAYYPKVRAGGLLCGHDYGNERFPLFGVNRAVNEFVKANGYELELGDDYTWFVRLPATSQKGLTP